MKKTLNVHCLPTKSISHLYLESDKYYYEEYPVPTIYAGNQHIYFTSQDEIKEGDWFELNREIFQCKSRDEIRQLSREHEVTQRIEMSSDQSINLPLIDEAFINLYAEKQGAIKEVEVEREYKCQFDYTSDARCFLGECDCKFQIKTNLDNTAIWSVKEENKTYTLEDMKKAHDAGINWASGQDTITKREREEEFNSWIKENI